MAYEPVLELRPNRRALRPFLFVGPIVVLLGLVVSVLVSLREPIGTLLQVVGITTAITVSIAAYLMRRLLVRGPVFVADRAGVRAWRLGFAGGEPKSLRWEDIRAVDVAVVEGIVALRVWPASSWATLSPVWTADEDREANDVRVGLLVPGDIGARTPMDIVAILTDLAGERCQVRVTSAR
ncbi:hypothetical protein GCM10009765_11350 [Fodinicola feengrottensis]|uniref:PH domain-containing protein n=2 Tax=Fodinicola feengrottensis TaxID=435914 RepID=A0ABP4RXW7_9ACTN